MVTKEVKFINKTGLHARPASEFAMQAKRFESKITICKEGGEPVNAKSVVRLLAEGIGKGTKAELVADGPDEIEAVNTLSDMIASGFGE